MQLTVTGGVLAGTSTTTYAKYRITWIDENQFSAKTLESSTGGEGQTYVFALIVPDCGEGNRSEREDSGQEQEKRHDPPVC
jgi:hypothetical protein